MQQQIKINIPILGNDNSVCLSLEALPACLLLQIRLCAYSIPMHARTQCFEMSSHYSLSACHLVSRQKHRTFQGTHDYTYLSPSLRNPGEQRIYYKLISPLIRTSKQRLNTASSVTLENEMHLEKEAIKIHPLFDKCLGSSC